MNTHRSESKAKAFSKRKTPYMRKGHRVERQFPFSREQVFFQLCPSRELDWIEGWKCDLLYTSDGYIEQDCIWTTPESNIFGPGLWIVTCYQPSRKLEFVRLIEDRVIEHARIHLFDNDDGTTKGVWELTFTALNVSGNEMVAAMPDEQPDLDRALDGLEAFLNTVEAS